MAKAKEKAVGLPKKARNPVKTADRGRTLPLWITDPRVSQIFDFLTKKWAIEGKIPGPIKSKAFEYMVHNFGEAAKRAPENGSLRLDSEHRGKVTYLAELFKVTGEIPSGADVEVVNAAIDIAHGILIDEQAANAYIIRKRGRP